MSRELNINQRVRTSLRRHAHQLVAAGYALLTPSAYATWKEPDITGELCRAIAEYMASDAAPRWITQYALRDDPKLNVAGKLGESRPRIDIELERVQRGQRPLFRFEAKRMGPNHPVSKYLGSEGLGAFLSNYYPLTHPEAGMLAYIQEKDLRHWTSSLKVAMSSNPELRLKTPGMVKEILAQGLNTWRTEHHRSSGDTLMIWHTLLLFCE